MRGIVAEEEKNISKWFNYLFIIISYLGCLLEKVLMMMRSIMILLISKKTIWNIQDY